MKIKKLLIAIIPLCILLGISAILFAICYKKTDDINKFMNKDTISALWYEVNDQKEINNKLNTLKSQKKYTFKDAYVELNPYKISPLSAIIIFNTNKEESIQVYINDEFVTTTDETKEHIIPIYGLYEDYNNQVKLVKGEEEVTYEIKTDKSNINYPLNVEIATEEINNQDIYFTVSSYETYLTGWDKTGKLRFYLTEDNRMDVEFLDNGHFIIGVTQDQTREQFVGFVEMDYLGKIYNYYTLENGYSFEFQILSNGNYMLAGGNEAIYMDEQVVYELDPKTGNKASEINLSEIILQIDPNFNKKYLGAAAIRNGFYYDETTKELLVSFREISTIFSFNYETKQLNWIFTDPNNQEFQNDVWKNYFVKLRSGRYPLGQHTPQITKDGKIAFFNNGYDRYNIAIMKNQSDLTNDLMSAYSSVEIYDIDSYKNARLIYSYDENKSLFSIKYGLFRVLENDNKLMNFGYVLTDEYRNGNNSVIESESNIDSMYTLILELNSKNEVIFRATSEEGKYRVFKHYFYNEITNSTNVSELNIFNTIKDESLKESNYKKHNLDVATEWIYDLTFTKNTFTSNYEIKADDEIVFLFVNKIGKVYEMTYKEKDNTKLKRVFNLELPNGEYAMFIKINDNIYNTQKNYSFEK